MVQRVPALDHDPEYYWVEELKGREADDHSVAATGEFWVAAEIVI